MSVNSPALAFQTDIKTWSWDLTVARDGYSKADHYTAKFKTIFVERCDGDCWLLFGPGDKTQRINLRSVRRVVFPRACEHFWIENPPMSVLPNNPDATGVIIQTSMDAIIEAADIRTTPLDTTTVSGLVIGATSTLLASYPCLWLTLFNLDNAKAVHFAVDEAATLTHPIIGPGEHLDIFINDTGRLTLIAESPVTVAAALHRNVG